MHPAVSAPLATIWVQTIKAPAQPAAHPNTRMEPLHTCAPAPAAMDPTGRCALQHHKCFLNTARAAPTGVTWSHALRQYVVYRRAPIPTAGADRTPLATPCTTWNSLSLASSSKCPRLPAHSTVLAAAGMAPTRKRPATDFSNPTRSQHPNTPTCVQFPTAT